MSSSLSEVLRRVDLAVFHSLVSGEGLLEEDLGRDCAREREVTSEAILCTCIAFYLELLI